MLVTVAGGLLKLAPTAATDFEKLFCDHKTSGDSTSWRTNSLNFHDHLVTVKKYSADLCESRHYRSRTEPHARTSDAMAVDCARRTGSCGGRLGARRSASAHATNSSSGGVASADHAPGALMQCRIDLRRSGECGLRGLGNRSN